MVRVADKQELRIWFVFSGVGSIGSMKSQVDIFVDRGLEMAFLACADMVHKSVLLGNSNEINNHRT